MDCIDSIKKYIDKNLSEKRRNHTYGVRDTALKLADKYGCDKEKAEKAALLHDIFRGVSPDVLNYHVRHLGLDSRYVNDANLAHGPVAGPGDTEGLRHKRPGYNKCCKISYDRQGRYEPA